MQNQCPKEEFLKKVTLYYNQNNNTGEELISKLNYLDISILSNYCSQYTFGSVELLENNTIKIDIAKEILNQEVVIDYILENEKDLICSNVVDSLSELLNLPKDSLFNCKNKIDYAFNISLEQQKLIYYSYPEILGNLEDEYKPYLITSNGDLIGFAISTEEFSHRENKINNIQTEYNKTFLEDIFIKRKKEEKTRKELMLYESILYIRNEILDLKNEIKNIFQDISKINKEKVSQEKNIKNLNSKIEAVDSNVKSVNNVILFYKNKLNLLLESIDIIENNLQKKNDIISSLEQKIIIFETTNSDIINSSEEIPILYNEINKLIYNLNLSNERIKLIQREIENINNFENLNLEQNKLKETINLDYVSNYYKENYDFFKQNYKKPIFNQDIIHFLMTFKVINEEKNIMPIFVSTSLESIINVRNNDFFVSSPMVHKDASLRGLEDFYTIKSIKDCKDNVCTIFNALVPNFIEDQFLNDSIYGYDADGITITNQYYENVFDIIDHSFNLSIVDQQII